MIDQAGILMAQGSGIACERIQGVNDNMSQSHYHEYYEIYYLEAGERFHMVEDKLYKMEAGEFIIFPPYVMHHSYGAENMPFKRVLLYFSQEEILWPSILSELREEGGIYKVGIRERQEIHRAMELILKEQKNPGAYHEEISLEMLAQMFYVSPYYLCREFKKNTNSTIIRYINVTRIMNAQRKFMETSKNITDISKETGFSNLTHFNRVFKSVTGMSPSQYRKQFRDNVKS